MIGTASAIGGVLGYYYVFLLLGFSPIGPDRMPVASYCQSKIGIVSAKSLFSICQSLSMTLNGSLSIATSMSGLTILAGMATAEQLDWCTCQYDMQHKISK